MKKSWLSLGMISISSVPIISLISCSSTEVGYDYSHLNELKSDIDVVSPIGAAENGLINSLDDVAGQGSLAALPVMNQLGSLIDSFDYEATGSVDGFQAALGMNDAPNSIADKDFGITSSLIIPNSYEATYWTHLRTLTWGFDAIAIALHLPPSIKIINNERPVINMQGITKLYDKEHETTITWGDLLENEDHKLSNEDTLNQQPIPMGRNSGRSASGTANGFWYILNRYFDEKISTVDFDHEALAGNGGKVTLGSDLAALDALKNEVGSMTYLPLSYAVLNQDQNMVVASIRIGDETVWVPSTNNAKLGEYNWLRPFNIIYSVDPIDNKGVKMAQLLLSTEGQKALVDNGFFQLTTQEFIEQFSATDLNTVKTDLLLDDTAKLPAGGVLPVGPLGLEIPKLT